MERPLDYSKCARPGCDEDEGRIDNYCSVYCRDVDELYIEITRLEVLEKACVEFYCGVITKAQWRDAVRQSPEGQRLIALGPTDGPNRQAGLIPEGK